MRHSSIPFHSPGFSLIEVLFAVVLLSVVLFGVIRLQIGQLHLSETQKNEVHAYALAHQYIERAKALGKDQWSAACLAENCRCAWTENQLSCSQDAQTPLEEFLHYFKVDKTGLIDAWQVISIVEWADGSGLHDAEGGGGAQVKRIVY